MRVIYFIALKDMRVYYFKPSNISWGMLFPLVFIFAFYLRHPVGFVQLIPGLLCLSLLFSTTSVEATVITFEMMTGTMERMMLYPVSVTVILSGKIARVAFFGLAVTTAMLLGLSFISPLKITNPVVFISSMVISSFAFSALGAFASVTVKQVFGAQTLTNIFRFPMIFLSEVFIPVSDSSPTIKPLAYFMPLTYSIDYIKTSLDRRSEIFRPIESLTILLLFALVLLGLSVWILKGRMS